MLEREAEEVVEGGRDGGEGDRRGARDSFIATYNR